MQQRDENKPELKMIKMSDVQSQTVDWLWYPFIPYGKLTIIQGDPGDGKTTLVLNIAAKLSKGEGLDSDMKITEIFEMAEELNISKRTLENAKKELGIKARRISNSWYWDLDKVKSETTKNATLQNV